jgi:hypothetical protein
MTIPSTAIAIDGDTAWWIVEHPLCPTHAPCDCGRFGLPFGLPHCKLSCELGSVTGLARALDLDRPCDTWRPICNRIGTGFGKPDHNGCPDCHGSKRHTFTLDVREPCRSDVDRWNDIKTLSVHVVEVLPIIEWDTVDLGLPHPVPCMTIDPHGNALEADEAGVDWFKAHDRTLPPDAAPGMFAVRLAIHKGEYPQGE